MQIMQIKQIKQIEQIKQIKQRHTESNKKKTELWRVIH
jgi:hypothetical protein